MRCLAPLTACIVGPLALTAGAGLFLGSLACVAFCAGIRAPAGNGRATPEDEAAEGRAGAPDAAARARRRRAL
jgi:hypothetical protein